jgi:hypothetical protein
LNAQQARVTDDDDVTAIAPGQSYRPRRARRRILLTASDNLPIAQFVCAVTTSAAALLYVVERFLHR